VLLLGGARSGKSSLAVRLARESGRAVTFVATARASDDEMAERIARHRADRPSDWTTVEEPVALERAVRKTEAGATLVVDCLSLWVANVLEAGRDEEEIGEEARAAAAVAASRTAPTVAVSNEVGLGIVPVSPLARRYRDVLGRVNAEWAAAANESALVVAGRVLPLMSADSLLRG
jgi:adenosyl cobinamide kinase/adenosyl cobinamide phosphate guanylyltransferase